MGLTRQGWGFGVAQGAYIGGALLLGVSSGCGFKIEKQVNPQAPGIAEPSPPPLIVPKNRVLGYNSLKTQLFQPRCIRCHGTRGGVNLETYAKAVSFLDQIKEQVLIEKSMPPSGALSDGEQKLIRDWINVGAPQDDVEVSAEPSPVPSGEPLPKP